MRVKAADIVKALRLLSEYNGKDPYFWILKKKSKTSEPLTSLDYEYILTNYNRTPETLNKLVKIQEWVAKQKQDKWQIDFLPEKIVVATLYGETADSFVCDVVYSKYQEKPVLTFLPKTGFITPLKVEDFDAMKIDFTPFNNKLKQINPAFSLMPHQERAVKFLLTRKKCILALDQGTGKTMTSIVASEILKDKRVLIICPESIKTNWQRELIQFVPEDEVSLIRGIDEMSRSELIEFLELKDASGLNVNDLKKYARAHGKWKLGKKYTIINFDIIGDFHQLPASRSIVDREASNAASQLLQSKFDIIIIDEAHNLSNKKSNRSAIVYDYLRQAHNEYVWLLTGTMVTNNPVNLYSVLRLIESDITGDYTRYMERYAGARKTLRKGEWDRLWQEWSAKHKDLFGKPMYTDYRSMTDEEKQVFKDYVDKYGKHAMVMNESTNLAELAERIQHLYFRVTKDELPHMVQKEVIPIAYTLTPDQRFEYMRLWKEYEAQKLAEGIDLSDVKQLIEVSVYRQYISRIMTEKTKYAVSKLISQGKKVFVVCAFDEEIYALKDYFGDKSVLFNGKITAKQKDFAVNAFNNDPNVMVFLGNINAASTGINLHKSCHIALFQSPNFSYADFAQVCDRIHRIGSTTDVKIYVQYFKDTIYEHILDIIKSKQEVFDGVIRTETEKTSN